MRGAVSVVPIDEPALDRVGIHQAMLRGMTQNFLVGEIVDFLEVAGESLQCLAQEFSSRLKGQFKTLYYGIANISYSMLSGSELFRWVRELSRVWMQRAK